jgi:hypothetical protein
LATTICRQNILPWGDSSGAYEVIGIKKTKHHSSAKSYATFTHGDLADAEDYLDTNLATAKTAIDIVVTKAVILKQSKNFGKPHIRRTQAAISYRNYIECPLSLESSS